MKMVIILSMLVINGASKDNVILTFLFVVLSFTENVEFSICSYTE